MLNALVRDNSCIREKVRSTELFFNINFYEHLEVLLLMKTWSSTEPSRPSQPVYLLIRMNVCLSGNVLKQVVCLI